MARERMPAKFHIAEYEVMSTLKRIVNRFIWKDRGNTESWLAIVGASIAKVEEFVVIHILI